VIFFRSFDETKLNPTNQGGFPSNFYYDLESINSFGGYVLVFSFKLNVNVVCVGFSKNMASFSNVSR